jgi:hypothetical protein
MKSQFHSPTILLKETPPMRLLRKWLAAASALTLLISGTALARSVVCRLEGIAGFDEEAARARNVIGSESTTDLRAGKVFITKKGSYLYAHSNLVSRGARHPTKIATNDTRDLSRITANLYTTALDGRFTPLVEEIIREGHRAHVEYYLDQSLFDSSGKLELDLEGAEKLYVLFGGIPPPKPLVATDPIRGPPFAAEYYPSVYVKVTSSASPASLFARLEQRAFEPRGVKFTSLIADTAVEAAIKRSDTAKVWEKSDITTGDGLKEFFRRNKCRVVILLGHVEGEDFVSADAKGKVGLKVSLSRVDRMPEEAGCDAVLLGCSSARAGTPVGVDKPFNPVEAVQRLSKALSAKTYSEFVRTLANRDMGLVLAETAFDRAANRVDADVYAREASKSESLLRESNRVGRLVLAFGISSGMSGSDSDGSGPGAGKRWNWWLIGGGVVIVAFVIWFYVRPIWVYIRRQAA